MRLRHYLFVIPIFLIACSSPDAPPPSSESEDVPTSEALATVPPAPTAEESLPEPEVEVNDSAEVVEESVETEAVAEDAAESSAVSLVSDYLGSYTISDTGFGTEVNVTVDEGANTRTIVTNALPNHETGEFPNSGNPNAISVQDRTWTFPVEPTFTGSATFARTPGVAINGVKFEPNTAERATCDTGEVHSIEAIQDVTDLGLDFNNAHVQPTGEYHYHGVSELLVAAFDTDQDLVHVAFAADGHNIYYSKSGAYQASYRLGAGEREGTNCTYTPGGQNGTTITFGSVKDGALWSDWDYSPEYGDLDECNGTMIDGEYVYLITNDYPYISRCLMGEFSEAGGGGGQPGGGQGEGRQPGGGEGGQQGGREGGQEGRGGRGGGPPDFDAAAAALGVTADQLREAMGPPPGDIEGAAATLGVSVEELQNALGQQAP